MARKVRRVKSAAIQEMAPTTSPPPAPAPAPREENLRDDYGYVLRDLRQIFILAGVLFLLLIALNVLL
jgi:hypothetical protein